MRLNVAVPQRYDAWVDFEDHADDFEPRVGCLLEIKTSVGVLSAVVWERHGALVIAHEVQPEEYAHRVKFIGTGPAEGYDWDRNDG